MCIMGSHIRYVRNVKIKNRIKRNVFSDEFRIDVSGINVPRYIYMLCRTTKWIGKSGTSI